MLSHADILNYSIRLYHTWDSTLEMQHHVANQSWRLYSVCSLGQLVALRCLDLYIIGLASMCVACIVSL